MNRHVRPDAVLAFDHLIVTVKDFDAAADRIYAEHGLASVAGGVHPGHGTGNRVIPLGRDYVELMAVVDDDEAARSPLGRWVTERVAHGDNPAALCLRTDEIEGIAERLDLELLEMSRRRTDGGVLRWRLAGLDAALSDGLPFFIEWLMAPGDHPGHMSAGHANPPIGIDWVEIGGNRDKLEAWVGPHDLALRAVDAEPGIRRFGIRTERGVVQL